ncbi:hypothetical protein RND81_01G089100 [Saponaria officinalis]|uniref:Uncharacterized protein n=1 Tax=Saponaria officinalis TaxID=3572 RepID=A0AAW1NDZ7_SAPOF
MPLIYTNLFSVSFNPNTDEHLDTHPKSLTDDDVPHKYHHFLIHESCTFCSRNDGGDLCGNQWHYCFRYLWYVVSSEQVLN